MSLCSPTVWTGASVHQLVGDMFPRDKVEEGIGVKIILCIGLCAERAPLPTQMSNKHFSGVHFRSRCRWMVMIFRYFDVAAVFFLSESMAESVF